MAAHRHRRVTPGPCIAHVAGISATVATDLSCAASANAGGATVANNLLAAAEAPLTARRRAAGIGVD
jgi:hypothetical protein